ncbi:MULTISPECIES: hypothetical protein [Actinosynnema]|uniref:hypothetical protein n=1 Tax=Actinosynnema TaxID=40566 RepID=UPI0020A39710|nr:hypothetical protein [Actinosynnema pretiosum]MCP2092695.1 hypothetical protein [Actinosynnema pretiosum]
MLGTPAPAGYRWRLLIVDRKNGEPQRNHLVAAPRSVVKRLRRRNRQWTLCGVALHVRDLGKAYPQGIVCADCWVHAIGQTETMRPLTPGHRAYQERKRAGRRGELADRVAAINWDVVPQ